MLSASLNKTFPSFHVANKVSFLRLSHPFYSFRNQINTHVNLSFTFRLVYSERVSENVQGEHGMVPIGGFIITLYSRSHNYSTRLVYKEDKFNCATGQMRAGGGGGGGRELCGTI